MNLFLAPHNDDEALFGAYIIQVYKPLVLVLTDSYIQYERGEAQSHKDIRTAESQAAMRVLGAEVEFLHIPDKDLNPALLEQGVKQFIANDKRFEFNDSGYRAPDVTFAPAIEGGNWHHDITGEAADRMFTNVRHYYTYTKDRDYPQGEVQVQATQEQKQRKLQALQCYSSQMLNVCKQYFITPHKEEFLNA